VFTMTTQEVMDINPALGGILQQAGVTEYTTDQIPVIDADTGKITMMNEQEARDADLYLPIELFTNPDDPEANKFVSELKASGIDSIRLSDMPWLYNPNPDDPTKWAIMSPNQRLGVDNPNAQIPDLTTGDIRAQGDAQSIAIAN